MSVFEHADTAALRALAEQNAALESRVAVLEHQLKGALADVELLAARAAALAAMLVEAGQVDEKILGYRVEAALEEERALRARPRCHRCLQYGAPERMALSERGWACDPRCATSR